MRSIPILSAVYRRYLSWYIKTLPKEINLVDLLIWSNDLIPVIDIVLNRCSNDNDNPQSRTMSNKSPRVMRTRNGEHRTFNLTEYVVLD